MKLHVISLFRDSAHYLARTFRNLEALERRHQVAYFFYENDSVDDTTAQLQAWMRERDGVLITETLHAKKFARTRERERTAALAFYRSRILPEAQRVPSDWTLLLDSDVDFPETLIEEYMPWADPRIAMLTPRTEFEKTCRMCDPPSGRPAYYDTFALRDRSDRRGMIISCNPFWADEDRSAWERGDPVEVHCAFAGAALIRSDVLARCEWRSVGDCEHVVFAEQVRRMGAIVALPAVRTFTEAGDGFTSPETFEMQKRLLANPLLLQFWTERTRNLLPT